MYHFNEGTFLLNSAQFKKSWRIFCLKLRSSPKRGDHCSEFTHYKIVSKLKGNMYNTSGSNKSRTSMDQHKSVLQNIVNLGEHNSFNIYIIADTAYFLDLDKIAIQSKLIMSIYKAIYRISVFFGLLSIVFLIPNELLLMPKIKRARVATSDHFLSASSDIITKNSLLSAPVAQITADVKKNLTKIKGNGVTMSFRTEQANLIIQKLRLQTSQ
jgi:hypothetical protein